MRFLSFFLALLFCSSGAAVLHAQKAPIKWGKISEEHQAMAAFPADTNAAAVVLADYATLHFSRNFEFTFERHRRIKILSEAGYDEWGTFSIPYLAEDGIQKVSGVRGQTFTAGPNGKVERHKMKKGDVFDEDIDGRWRRVRFTLPALEPGAVVEYRYRLRSTNPILLPSWQFQTSEPVLWSEYVLEIPDDLAYVQAARGILGFEIEEKQPVIRPWGEGKQYRFAMQDVPALREEPYMTTPDDYRAQIEFQLHSYRRPDYGVEKVLHTWEELAKELMSMDRFGRQLDRPRRALREQVAALTAGLESPAEKVQALYDYARTNLTWSGEMGYILDQDLDDVLKTRRGSSPEIALLLVSMLRETGIEAHPVLISTRSHGQILDVYPLLSQFNDVLVYAEAGRREYLLDATDPLRPHSLLPYESLNGRGWLVRKEGAEWIPITALGKHLQRVMVTAELGEDGSVAGELHVSDDQYSALEKRRGLREAADPEEFVRTSVFTGLGEVSIASYLFEHQEDPYEALGTQVVFTVPAYGQAAGDFLYLNPHLVGRLEQNPLRLPERTFPVDLAYPRDVFQIYRMKLPAGFAVQEHPANLRVNLPSGGGRFQRIVAVEGDEIVMQTKFLLEKAVFSPGEYGELRAFFDAVVAAQAEQVVLKRSEDAERSAAVQGGER